MFRCPCWGQVLSKHLRSAVAAPSSISSSSCFVSILASSGGQRLETDAITCTQGQGFSYFQHALPNHLLEILPHGHSAKFMASAIPGPIPENRNKGAHICAVARFLGLRQRHPSSIRLCGRVPQVPLLGCSLRTPSARSAIPLELQDGP